MADRLLLRGGTVLTVDPDLGDLPTGDVLIEGDTIAQVAPRIDADAEVIDASGRIVIPGFVDTHRHTWEAAIRGCAPNATLGTYFVEVLDSFAPLYRPEDVYASNLAGALECVNAGITTLVDWSHINNTPEHPDAGIRGLQEAGIRAQYAYGSANTSLNDYWNNSKIAIPADDVRRVRDTYFSSGDGLLTMALATRGPTYCNNDVVRAEWALARELGIPITIHVAMHSAGRFGMVKQLGDLGLLGPDTTYIHCCYLTDEEWQLVADSGGTVSIAPQIEAQMGHGWPPVLKSMDYGLRPSLSIDVVTTAPGDIFTQIRAAFACDRARVNAAGWEAGAEGDVSDTMLTSRQMLELATINGAHVAGLEDRTGSLTPGKQADVVLLDATALNVAPVIDPVAAVTNCADVSNVDTVLIGGQVRKRDGKLRGRHRGGTPAGRGVPGPPAGRARAQAGRTAHGMTGRHLVARAGEPELVVPGPFAGRSQGFTRWAVVGEAAGAAHTGFGLCALASPAAASTPTSTPSSRACSCSRAAWSWTPPRGRWSSGRATTGWSRWGWPTPPATRGRSRPAGPTCAPPSRGPGSTTTPSSSRPWPPPPRSRSTSATPGPGPSGTSTRPTWTPAARPRTSSPSRPACAPPCWSTAASP